MTPRQVELVQSSWSAVEPIADAAAEMFYSKLFALDPSLRALFRGDMQEQGRKLGKAFTPDVRDAWATAYGVLATTMKDAAKLAA